MEIIQDLDHPNILKMYEFYEDERRYYLVMELCTGGELYDEMVYQHKFEEDQACQIITQIIESVAFCHRRGIIHRDLKPENILLDSKRRYNAKLIDFSSSARLEKNKRFKRLIGTPYYIAPEVLLNEYD